jgi:hypothetical protein
MTLTELRKHIKHGLLEKVLLQEPGFEIIDRDTGRAAYIQILDAAAKWQASNCLRRRNVWRAISRAYDKIEIDQGSANALDLAYCCFLLSPELGYACSRIKRLVRKLDSADFDPVDMRLGQIRSCTRPKSLD